MRLPVGPALTMPLLAMVSMSAGRHLQQAHLCPTPWADRARFDALDVLTAVYLVTDTTGRLRWLGQASRPVQVHVLPHLGNGVHVDPGLPCLLAFGDLG
ncbi:hypothetical protein [Streptomyces sp. CBMA156]|uniref:hypothetical protein n=1 Tax=Streptomyces sp. CBMA156 TaxID=1930280 RepID=UPI001662186F|nr:hypothetical protein [Streptomyces sp. CBMA156]